MATSDDADDDAETLSTLEPAALPLLQLRILPAVHPPTRLVLPAQRSSLALPQSGGLRRLISGCRPTPMLMAPWANAFSWDNGVATMLAAPANLSDPSLGADIPWVLAAEPEPETEPEVALLELRVIPSVRLPTRFVLPAPLSSLALSQSGDLRRCFPLSMAPWGVGFSWDAGVSFMLAPADSRRWGEDLGADLPWVRVKPEGWCSPPESCLSDDDDTLATDADGHAGDEQGRGSVIFVAIATAGAAFVFAGIWFRRRNLRLCRRFRSGHDEWQPNRY